MSGVGELGQPDDKWTTGTRQSWNRDDKVGLTEATISATPVRGALTSFLFFMDALKPYIQAKKEAACVSMFAKNSYYHNYRAMR